MLIVGTLVIAGLTGPINVDIEAGSGGPSAAYGASGEVGVWNTVSTAASNVALVNTAGGASGVTFSIAGAIPYTFDNPLTSGDDERLFDDLACATVAQTITLRGLTAVGGGYDLHVYGWLPDDPSQISRVQIGGGPVQDVGGAFVSPAGGYGATYIAFAGVNPDAGGELVITAVPAPGSSISSINGIQLRYGCELCGEFCAGNVLSSCPCNPGNLSTGCEIAQQTGGVRLDVVSQDTVGTTATMQATGFPPMATPTAIVVRANDLEPVPVPFGDGLRCVGLQGFARLAATAAVAGSSSHTFGHGAGSGAYYYQVWFRNTPTSYCVTTGASGGAFNLSNGQALVW